MNLVKQIPYPRESKNATASFLQRVIQRKLDFKEMPKKLVTSLPRILQNVTSQAYGFMGDKSHRI